MSFSFGTQSSGGFSFGDTSTSFGNTSSGFSFGQSSSTQSSGFSFGDTGGGFGSSFSFGPQQSTGSTFSFSLGDTSSQWGAPMTQQQVGQHTVEGAMKYIIDSYNANSHLCKFNYFFYNVVEEGKVMATLNALRQQYAKLIPDAKWIEAMQRNPDPKKFVPVPARSFTDLKLRVEEQQKRIQSFNATIKVLQDKIDTLQRNHEIKTAKKIEQIKQKHMELSLRVLKVQKRLEVLMQKGIGIGSEDISLKNKLTAMQRELNKPNQYRGRLNELLPQLNYYLQNVHSLIPSDTLDNETLLAIQKFLEQQTQGLKKLINIVKKDLRDTNYIITTLDTDTSREKTKISKFPPLGF